MTALSNVELSAINCTAMFAKAECTSTAIARLVKPRKKYKPIPHDRRNWFRSDVDLCGGSHYAALMLGQLRYWVDKKGNVWNAMSATDWFEQLGFEENRVRTATKVLIDRELIEIALLMYAGSPTRHFRLLDQAINHPLISTDGIDGEGPPVEITTPSVEINGSSTKTSTKTKILETKILSTGEQESFATTIHPVSLEMHQGEVETSDYEKDEMENIWLGALVKYGKKIKTLTEKQREKQRSQLDRIWYQIRTELHTPVADVIDVIISKWSRFTDLFGDLSTNGPTPGWLLKNLGWFTLMFRMDPDDEDLLPEEFLKVREWWINYFNSTLDLRKRFANDLSRTDYISAPKETPAKPLAIVEESQVPERTTEGPLPLTEAQKEAALKNYLATTLAKKATPANYLFGN